MSDEFSFAIILKRVDIEITVRILLFVMYRDRDICRTTANATTIILRYLEEIFVSWYYLSYIITKLDTFIVTCTP